MTLTDKNQKTLNDIVKKVGLDEKIKLEGKLEEKIETAKEMILDREGNEKIKKYTKLDDKTIDQLRKELNN